ncbi:PhoH family protein [Roseinatronobacter bogoriensis]|uniref:PhoH-like protein n=1 Tax=Roseinatronobacter bogoriensis subsp. barguzinensis TaxID=441209 RepID=A0A2K8KGJ7_9RHOB|nr:MULTISPECIES: PhoH family protein [Rhodobaca]ATX66885.1 PhoH family protein [Rhodobaca barguzinensis]MBB4206363.1 phosphate starvation-inducible PhoH-like protein [Rhodobaca bogoriensis DSM 18756]TDW41108.1 phosphate starvation-inducible protein PhoH [Rhodobaca barguzinensis]TDY74714.1 phosphate starvation-inducible PhoH-like protein [Rhodobaca bogoriensis DSM 18756]
MGISALTPPPPATGNAPSHLEFSDNRLLVDLCGEYDRNLTHLESHLGVQIIRRGNQLDIIGTDEARAQVARILEALYERLEEGRSVEPGDVAALIKLGTAPETPEGPAEQLEMFRTGRLEIRTRKKIIAPRTKAQQDYTRALLQHEMNFGIGPAGTGKTYIAVAVAVQMFSDGLVDKILLSRPAVEAGERLGFLPGDMKEKIDPYMQPLYDALNDFLPGKQLQKLMEERRIEIAPLAFMRGRTLSNAFVVLDEAQNATEMQMKMFLTRLGEGSRMAITGDRSQVDLPRGMHSGLRAAERILDGVDGIGFSYFTSADVVRHPLVARIIQAYERDEEQGA